MQVPCSLPALKDGVSAAKFSMKAFFDITTNLLSKALEYTETRHRLLSNNIANLDTPNYKAVDLTFEDALRRAVEGGGMRRGGDAALVFYTSNAAPDPDGNTVEIEEQVMKMTENNILHHSFVNLVKMKFRMLESAISESRR